MRTQGGAGHPCAAGHGRQEQPQGLHQHGDPAPRAGGCLWLWAWVWVCV